jgi:hypothetical protein
MIGAKLNLDLFSIYYVEITLKQLRIGSLPVVRGLVSKKLLIENPVCKVIQIISDAYVLEYVGRMYTGQKPEIYTVTPKSIKQGITYMVDERNNFSSSLWKEFIISDEVHLPIIFPH